MKLFGRDLDAEVAIVAEIGVNHEGDAERAAKLIRLAAEAGADAVKLQHYTPERYASASDPERLERVRRFALGEDSLEHLLRTAEAAGVPLFSTPVTEDWVDHLDAMPAIKIASGDLTFEPVVRAAAATGKPILLSTGLSEVDEIDRAVDWVRDEVGTRALPDRLVLLHCVSAYPTPIEQANVRAVPYLHERYGLRVGWSNHVLGIEACLAAVALGACVVEVHFTDQRTGRAFRDHELSCDPPMLRQLVSQARPVRVALGEWGKRRQPAEIGNLAAIRKGVVAARDLEAGHVLRREDLGYARPASEFAAEELETLVGRSLLGPVLRGHVVPRDVVDVGDRPERDQ
jgi:N,N'-diacetyllegionaminate synthase